MSERILSVLGVSIAVVLTGCSQAQTEVVKSRSTQSGFSAAGRHFGFIRATNAKTRTITFDQAEFLTGRPAQRAAEQDGVVAPGEAVPNDYYIRNRDKRTRVLRVAPDATVRAAAPVTSVNVKPPKQCGYSTKCGSGYPMRLAIFFAARPHDVKFWVTVRGGLVVSLVEQYVP